MNEQQNTYYHYQGFIYGPTASKQPDYPNAESYKEYSQARNEDFYHYGIDYVNWAEKLFAGPKYRWKGRPLENWREMVEGKDFVLRYHQTHEGHTNSVDYYAVDQFEKAAHPINQ